MINVSVLVGSDKRLPDMVRACGAHTTTIDVADVKVFAAAATRQPDVLVVDVRDGSTMPAELVEIKRHHPSTGILVVLPRLDGALLLQAMRAGASECVAEPITRDELERAFARIAAQRPAPRRGDVFAVIGAKGGVGATTVAVNVATILNKLRASSTLLMDVHLTYGDAATFLGAEPRFSALDALENMHRLDAAFLRTLITQTKSGLHLLASSNHPVTTPVEAAHMRSLIELAATEFPYVVLDVPRSDAAALDSLEPAGSIVVVANQEVTTVRSAARMAGALEQRYGKERVTVVITRYDAGAEIRQQDVERVVGRPVSYVFPNNYAIALASLNNGRPLVLDNHTKLASALTSFANQLAGLPGEHSTREKSGGLLSMFGSKR
jgi:pilus assembly protein CpaE